MKGIGTFVLLLLVGGAVVTYFVTRPPNRHLDAAGQAWVDGFAAWRESTVRTVDRADASIGLSTRRLSPALVRSLDECSATLRRVGMPPGLLDVVLRDADTACGEVDSALAANQRFGPSALATTKQHLARAESWLQQARLDLHDQLTPSSP
jgi:hypothetical protein